jgi:hypothetical protein
MPSQAKKYFTTSEVAKLANRHPNSVRRWCQLHGFGVRLTPGGYWYIPASNVTALLATEERHVPEVV